MSGPRVGAGDCVVSGIGLVAAVARTAQELHLALCRGLPCWSPDSPGPAGDTLSSGAPAAPIAGFNVREHLDRRGLKDLSRTSQLACAAAAPLAAALDGMPASEVGVVLGSCWGSLPSIVDFEWETCTVPVRLVNPLLFAETVPNVPAGQISIQFGWSAFNLTVSSGPASGLAAIGEGLDLLAAGRAPVVVAGGADAINTAALRVLRADGVTAAGPGSRPFGLARSGAVGGEGACLFILESAERARARGARPLARLRAAAARFAPPRETGPGPRGSAPGARESASGPRAEDLAAMLRDLLERAALGPRDVQLVAASACGSPEGDRAEAQAIHAVFGDGAEAPLVLAPKGILGETWGASGPLAAAAVIESMRTGRVPGRPRGFVPDPRLPPINMPPEPHARRVVNAVVLARTETGHLSALLLSEPEGRDAA